MTDPANDPANYRDLWERKPGLRAVYSDIYRRMLANAVPGSILELGGGSGNFKNFSSNAISTDIVPAPWLDAVCDAQRLPFASGAFSNVIMVDTIHHVEHPLLVMAEAARVLRSGGHLIFCEPAITPLSEVFYRLFHPEPVDMSANPLAKGTISTDKNPWDSNQAIPTLLTGRFRDAVAREVPALQLTSVDRFSFLAYPLSGGFRPWSLLPGAVAGPLLNAEWHVRRLLGTLLAFRLLAVYEKRS